jgi:hypothetical protein
MLRGPTSVPIHSVAGVTSRSAGRPPHGGVDGNLLAKGYGQVFT